VQRNISRFKFASGNSESVGYAAHTGLL
jgi:hypothetical protein